MSMPPISPRSRIDRLVVGGTRLTLVVVLSTVVVVAIAVSPIALRLLLDPIDRDWAGLSDIGQAYGPVSALLSATALCVVILVQRAQLRHERVWTVRQMHMIDLDGRIPLARQLTMRTATVTQIKTRHASDGRDGPPVRRRT